MKIELRKLAELRPYENYPRLNDDAVAAVAASIREFGFRQPLVVDADSVIICGHTRYKAALHLGLEKVPVHVAKDLSPEQIKAYRIADNQTATIAEWNYELLPIELADLQACNYDLGLLGFDADALAELLYRRAGAAGRGHHAAGRSMDSRGSSFAVRRQQQTGSSGPAARRCHDSPRQHGPALQREGGTTIK